MKVSLIKLEEIMAVLKEFKAVKNLMTVNEALVFLTASKFDEPTIGEIAKWSGVTNMSVSRIVFNLSIGNRRRKADGLDLLERYEDPTNRLHTRVRLTDKGRELLSRIAGK